MSPRKAQGGMALIVSLLLLLILTVLAISMATTSTLQERIAGNAQQQNIAFQAAESGLNYWVAQFIQSSTTPANGTTLNLQASTGTSGSAKVTLSATSFNCSKFLPAQSSNISEGSMAYNCYQISSQAKACKSLTNCNVTTSDGQARSLHRRSYIQVTHL